MRNNIISGDIRAQKYLSSDFNIKPSQRNPLIKYTLSVVYDAVWNTIQNIFLWANELTFMHI